MLMLFLFAPVPAADCRPHKRQQQQQKMQIHGGTERGGSGNTNTAVDESKLVLQFCTVNLCPGTQWCYCCMTEKPEPRCYHTMKMCKAVCPVCNPKCPPVRLPIVT
ncbi:hypothetical protein BS78_K003300 [Paspalum vaginatum]|uniref:Bowman-Birk serine protease inhibitors family domain-containing protein n=1 Tax=Paspalum vaginatum TaxID=158149 RepID=A0A9W7X9X3_9POAL|nr:hypothetical protein BS78_K003300 [Paspalum vaginatum]